MSAEPRRPSGGASSDGRASKPPSPNRAMLVAAVAVIVVVAVSMAGGALFFATALPLPQATPVPNLLGDTVPLKQADHVQTAAQLDLVPGLPPAGGPHFAQPERPGIFTAPVEDGRAIHSLEHGIVWISYRADLIAPADLEVLRQVAAAHPRDVLLSPRPANAGPAAITSWGRRLNLTAPISMMAVESFVVANVDKSPEPGVR